MPSLHWLRADPDVAIFLCHCVRRCFDLFIREDFERTGLNNLVTVGVRDIQGEGFPDNLSGRADSVFLDLPQPWLAIPSAAKMLQQDGVLCSFSPCIEQVQRSCETLKSHFTGIGSFLLLYCVRIM